MTDEESRQDDIDLLCKRIMRQEPELVEDFKKILNYISYKVYDHRSVDENFSFSEIQKVLIRKLMQ